MPDAGRRVQWSRFQEEVQAAVGGVAGEVSFQLARVSFDGGVHVPLPVTTVVHARGQERVAVFANGPGCFVHSADGTALVSTVAARDDMLRLAGWRVVGVDWHAWPLEREEQHAYVQRLLA